MTFALDDFLRAAPRLQRIALRALLALARRPRGAALLARLPAADQLAHATLGLIRYDDHATAVPLGWDAAAVVARGRELRAAASASRKVEGSW
ncbi:hypothetical protein [Conexibacter arvalis]|uniref:Uncharacterized protein n=1 Tax=Conexibacter arvalis TaxID=912552 RepID=A0A840IE64_9ACTN|nr:hypothetical protein [Conexibacter arvalis]MBB4663082.1 hypothetical protein [Conexibacter arvalis]